MEEKEGERERERGMGTAPTCANDAINARGLESFKKFQANAP